MPREVPAVVRRELEKPSTGETLIAFVTITHPRTSDVIRLVNDGVDYIRDGETWHKAGFEITPVSDTDRPGTAEFMFPNVKRKAIGKLRTIKGPPKVHLEVISTSYFDMDEDPRTVIPGETIVKFYEAHELFITNMTIDVAVVTGTLSRFDPSLEMYPNMLATQERLPGLYVL